MSKIKEKWLIWCELNAEQDELERVFGDDCVSIRGTTPDEDRIEFERLWREGDVPILISKPSLFGWGLNWQHCHNVVFVGISDSYESLVQATARVHRYGQQNVVNRYLIFSEPEREVFENLQRKAALADRIWESVKPYFAEAFQATKRYQHDYQPTQKMEIPSWLKAS